MKKKKIEEIRNYLIERGGEIASKLEEWEEGLEFLERSRPSELSEEAQEEALSLSLRSLDQQERMELRDIRNALEKLDKGTFGECDRCHRAIEPKRIEALPTARFCRSCQEQIEVSSNRMRNPLGQNPGWGVAR